MRNILILLALFNTLKASFYDRAMEGRYYYQEHEEEEETEITEETTLQELSTFKQKFEKAKALAVMVPTYENISNYLTLQNQVVQNAEKFSQIWATILLENAFLSDQLNNPTASFAISARKSLDYRNINRLLEQSKESHVLLFAFDSKNPYSQISADMVREFEYETNWKTIGISIDGGTLPQFPQPRFSTDRGVSLKIEATPSYIVVNPEKDQALPVGFGAISISQLKENIYKQLKDRKDP